jgi:chorismate synthase
MRFLTSGESHGRALITIIEGLPMGFPLSEEDINIELNRRKQGYGRGNRMNIEPERGEIYSGVKEGKTIGSPVAIVLANADWQKIQSPLTVPRPGHADLSGAIKYNTKNIRDIWERSSARETASRVMAGAVAKKILKELEIKITSYTKKIGSVELKDTFSFEEIEKLSESSPVRCPDRKTSKKMMSLIDAVKERGDSLGGIFEVVAINIPPGFGTYVHWDRRLDGLIAQAIMSIPSVKGVEIGGGFGVTGSFGSEVNDAINYDKSHLLWPFYRNTNFAGGVEGGITNGEPIIVRGAVKPVPTLLKPLPSIDLVTKERKEAVIVRTDVCIVPAAGVIGESMLAWVLADTILQELGGNNWEEVKTRYKQYLDYVKNF